MNAHTYMNLSPFEVAVGYIPQIKAYLTEQYEGKKIESWSKKLGFSLLHKHFPLQSGEALSRKSEVDAVSVRPVSDQADLVPYVWRVTRKGAHFRFEAVEFIDAADCPHDVLEFASIVASGNDDSLNELAQKIGHSGLEKFLGVSLRYFEQSLRSEGYSLVEHSFPNRRLRLALEANQELGEYYETLWCLSEDINAGTMCALHCASHCGCHD